MVKHSKWLLAAIAIGCFGSVLIGLGHDPRAMGQQAADPSDATVVGALEELQAAVVRAIDQAEESVVAIGRGPRVADRAAAEAHEQEFFDYAAGVIIDARGLILTNYHLLGNVSASRYVVWLPGSRRFTAQVKAADPWFDLAVLEVAATDLTPLPLGAAEQLHKGDFVIALGNPYAIVRDGSVSASWGLISNRRAKPVRANESAVPRTETLHQHGGLIETDARLKLGTSGGPLINLQGEMVGLLTNAAAIFGYDVAASYAIPVDAGLRRVLDQLKAGQEAEYGFLGIQVDPLAADTSGAAPPGVRVSQIVARRPRPPPVCG